MSNWITLEEARTNLKMWLEAERAVSTGQSYRIGTHSLTRASLSDIAKRLPNSNQEWAGGCEVFGSRPLIFKERT